MNRFEKLFAQKNKKIFVPFFTLGDPDFDQSFFLIKSAIDAGADALELGFAFSDPIADGPTNQRSMQRALKSGMSFDRSIALLQKIRQYNKTIPIGLLLYYNLLFSQGERAYEKLSQVGVDGVVCADLPFDEATAHLALLKKYDIGAVQMIAPNADDQRVKQLAQNSSAFNYVLSGFGTTGTKKEVAQETIDRVKHLSKLIDQPIIVGFGISSPAHVRKIWQAGADGAIVGSFFSSIIEANLDNIAQAATQISEFIKDVKNTCIIQSS
ncbi:tryptophan synthase subunit alpha [Facilibium subflavum]|uniref:tryptophan synthase subunit alpha n=1 Tax=Facilibium subflavum TaxID=2219058 RepID=UPI000E6507CA|nr:tryptophan synthase subunit alpha [Facilibium subflavum]